MLFANFAASKRIEYDRLFRQAVAKDGTRSTCGHSPTSTSPFEPVFSSRRDLDLPPPPSPPKDKHPPPPSHTHTTAGREICKMFKAATCPKAADDCQLPGSTPKQGMPYQALSSNELSHHSTVLSIREEATRLSGQSQQIVEAIGNSKRGLPRLQQLAQSPKPHLGTRQLQLIHQVFILNLFYCDVHYLTYRRPYSGGHPQPRFLFSNGKPLC